jgi:SAM-dependent methyltransferase
VHARLVLSHIPERAAVLARLVDALRPGGHLVVSELDPDHPYVPDVLEQVDRGPEDDDHGAIDDVCTAFSQTLREAGADTEYGFRFPDHARAAGLDIVDSWGYVARAIGWGHPAATLMQANIRQRDEAIVDTGLVSPDEVARALDAIEAGVGFVMPTLYTTVARKPEEATR